MTTRELKNGHVSAAQLRVMPLHAVTEVYGEPGLRRRLTLELHRLADADRSAVGGAARWATRLHDGQRRSREPYINHPLRVTLRMMCYYRVNDPEVLIAGLLHDVVEDQPWAVAGINQHGPPPVAEAFNAIRVRYGPRVTRLVAALTMPQRPANVDRIRHYSEHLETALDAEPWARVIKLSDFTDNGVGIIHSTGPVVTRSARKYDAAVPVLRNLLDRPDTPLIPDVKTHIRRQLDVARWRFAAILAA